jgi:hypothetical protein
MAKKMRKFAGEEGSLVDPLEKANKEFEANRKSEDKSDALGDFIAMNTAAKGSAEPYDKTFVDEDAKPKASAPKPKPAMNMGTAEGFKAHGGTRTEYLNDLNKLKSRAPAAAKEEAPAKKSSDASTSRVGILNRMREKDKAIPRGEDYTAAMAKQKASQAEKEPTPAPKQKSKVLSMQGVNPKTLLGQKTSNFAKGGSVTRGDGCAQRGKTRGMMR